MRSKWWLLAIVATVAACSLLAKAILRRSLPGAAEGSSSVANSCPMAGVSSQGAPQAGANSHATSVPGEGGPQGGRSYRRIVSLSPSITETLFALGLGDRVVGVTRYCRWPPEAQRRTLVGGYLDPNYEAIVALQPDLVILRGEKDAFVEGFRRLGLEVLAVRHQSVADILSAIETIGRTCGAAQQAEGLLADLRGRLERLRVKTAGLGRPRVLLVVERALGTGTIQDAYVAGADGFLNDMLDLAGGQNACPKTTVGVPVVSAEGVMQMNPDVIIDLMSPERAAGRSHAQLLADWKPLANVAAVRTGRLYVIDDEGILVPGPRFYRLAERLARLVHPEAAW